MSRERGDPPVGARTAADTTTRLLARAQAGDARRPQRPLQPARAAAQPLGTRPVSRAGRGTWPTRTTLCRRPCSRRLRTCGGSSRAGRVRFEPTCVRRCSIGSATRSGGSAAGRRSSGWTNRRPAHESSPLQLAIRQEQRERYEAALSRLKDSDRELIVARLELGMTYEEMAEALGKPSWNAARMAVVRALIRLASELKSG